MAIAVLVLYIGTQVVFPIVVLYWLALICALMCLFFVRRNPLWCGISLLATAGFLAPATSSTLAWTAMAIGGFAP